MKKYIAKLMALVLTISVLSSTSSINALAEETAPETQTTKINACSNEDKSSDGHITVSYKINGSTLSTWSAGDHGSKILTVSWDNAVDSVAKIKLNLDVQNVAYFETPEVTGGTLSNDGATNFIITDISGNSVEFRGKSDDWKTMEFGYAEVTYTLKPVYTVTFNANGNGTAPDSQTVYKGDTVARVSDPTAAGYNFEGWYKDASCTNAWDFDADAVTGDTTLYAKWILKGTAITSLKSKSYSISGDPVVIKIDGVDNSKLLLIRKKRFL